MSFLSVVLCTYNGARFLDEQLESLLIQTRLPDELVIRDDGSIDHTPQILTSFAARAPFPVRITINPDNLGSTQNFSRALLDCRGDIIVLCDQDDRWLPHKLEVLENSFENPRVGLVFSNAYVMDETGCDTGQLLWGNFALGEAEIQAIHAGTFALALIKRNRVTGMTMAFRASYLPLLLPIPTESLLLHDGWLALLLAAVSDVTAIEKPLAFYRQHQNQQVGLQVAPTHVARPGAHFRGHIVQLRELYRRLHRHRDLRPGVRSTVSAIPLHIAHIKRRLRFPRARVLRAVPIAVELLSGRYHRFSNGFKSAARDLVFSEPKANS